MTSCVWGYFFCERMNERETYVIMSQQGYFTTSKEHEISVCEPPSLFSSLSVSPLHCHVSVSSSVSSHLSPLWSESHPFSPPSFLFFFFFLGGKEDLNFKQKTQGGKLCKKHLKCFSLFSDLRNVIHTQGTVSKEAERSWLKPDNAHGSL